MGALLLALEQVIQQGEGIIVRHYGKKYGSGGMFFNAVICFFAMILNIASNGLIGVISRSQQIRFNHAYDNEYMILCFGGASIALLIFEFIKEGASFKDTIKYSTLYGILAGLCNGAKNFLNLLLYLYIPISVAVPLKTGCGFILSFLISVIFYKEKFSVQQLIGVVIGIIAMILFKF